VRPGQRAEIKVDANGRVYKGHVDSVAGSSGARLSLLPPENATGNYVKVVQRVPVKIVFEPGRTATTTSGWGCRRAQNLPEVVPAAGLRPDGISDWTAEPLRAQTTRENGGRTNDLSNLRETSAQAVLPG